MAAPQAAVLLALGWGLFLAWSAAGCAVLALGISESDIIEWVANAGLRSALVYLLRSGDVVWTVLAAANVYFGLVRQEGLRTARVWAAQVFVTASVVAWVGTVVGWPFGPLAFTARLGPRLGGVLPVGVPLLWCVIVLAARLTARWLLPAGRPWHLALGTGLMALVTDLNLEPVAWQVRAWWIWYPAPRLAAAWPPFQNFATWFLVATALGWWLAERNVAPRSLRPVRPFQVLLVLNGLCLVAHLARWLGA